MAKQRIDTLLVDLDLCTSRQQAQALIRTGQVSIDQQVIDKPGTEVDIAANILIKQRSRYVSRGGDKLAKALEIFAIPVAGRICLDGGISTGGFTDCLLQAGAALVYGIDVGYGQADWRLRNDPRVILKERTNLRYMTAAELYGDSPRADLAVVDVSFISLDKVLPALWELLAPPREAVLLVKPQFEVGRDRVGKKGVVRDSATQADAIFQVWKAATALGWQERGLTWSPLLGPAGNIEYLLWLGIDREQEPDQSAILFEGCANEEGVVKERIAQVAKAAAQELVK
ncbi:MAG: TlyA family RNA methyltransferase [Microcoleus sp. PH2017_29_MFU_D_A]|uniref:TlyA family RNA methyltransferase n=1 Tax=unclassified Microcoleus TaxID=2642155 RepID=UPI001DD44488|nr:MULTISPECIES: TlyA family RNA methyltransferase [unclassified Microcoleus]MCC3420333.1 TlyA family RNA methyltransferase [Microcoleus sp. PH2017_07_MST_O_A]MCC3430648.1 TlyA family RNA methyltransferase [Microcoleus sp. PH2017_04_SCI_O_A]MCC3444044.1 TlyA family RNA methyltransferase [Microcoleus sp. PH2017_03_ELD_O_A]MCC3468743.1 TlyA family RNA methyltransferase [Microcoleus sp. PH2017_06_SFM_O_A]MCC3505761.1 TlyA family RNA methyltransferase [Microcoleus sp. PH2017_19_SFW_U_A]MCC3512061